MHKAKKVLLIVNTDAFGRQMARWALTLKHQGEWEPIIYISADYMNRHMDICRKEGIIVLSPTLNLLPENNENNQTAQLRKTRLVKVRKLLHLVLGFMQSVNLHLQSLFPLRVCSTIIDLSKKLQSMRRIIRLHQVSAVLISESSPAYNAPVYIEAAHRECVPIVTSPIEKSNSGHYAESYLYEPLMSLNRPINRLIKMIYPNWVFSHKGYRIVRVMPELLAALKWIRIAPPHPWRLVGNKEDMTAVDSQSTFNYYSMQGISPKLMTVIGSPEHDIMSRCLRNKKRLKNELYDRLKLPNNRPLILSPLIPDHYTSGRPECDFQDYDKLVEFWVRSLGAIDNYNIVISLHPGHTYLRDPHSWDYIEQWGVRICTDDLATLVPLCDIYVATGYSTTVQWAIACGRPVINYDVYRYGLDIYRGLPGVLDIQEQQDFHDSLRRLTSEPDYYAEIVAQQEAIARQWGQLDGKASERLAQLFDRLVENYPKN